MGLNFLLTLQRIRKVCQQHLTNCVNISTRYNNRAQIIFGILPTLKGQQRQRTFWLIRYCLQSQHKIFLFCPQIRRDRLNFMLLGVVGEYGKILDLFSIALKYFPRIFRIRLNTFSDFVQMKTTLIAVISVYLKHHWRTFKI